MVVQEVRHEVAVLVHHRGEEDGVVLALLGHINVAGGAGDHGREGAAGEEHQE